MMFFRSVAALSIVAVLCATPSISADASPYIGTGWTDGGSTNGSSASLWAEYQQFTAGKSSSSVASRSAPKLTKQQLWWRATWERLFATPTCASYGTCVAPVPVVVAVAKEVTLADIQSFRPADPALASEPTGWAIVGLPVNLIANPGGGIVTGTLLGRSADVEFSAQSFTFGFGDGSGIETSSAGAPWRSLGRADFSDTSTSHRYGTAGLKVVSLTAHYSVRYRLSGGAWRALSGLVDATARPINITVFEGHSALVDRTCTESVRAAGC